MSRAQVIDVIETPGDTHYSTRPDEIALTHNGAVYASFGKAEIELAAGRLIQYFQFRGLWCPFTMGNLRIFYARRKWNWEGTSSDRGMLYGLYGHFLMENPNGWAQCSPDAEFVRKLSSKKYCITDAFIAQCSRPRSE